MIQNDKLISFSLYNTLTSLSYDITTHSPYLHSHFENPSANTEKQDMSL